MNYYYYDQPVPGLDEAGQEVTCNERVIISERDAIRSMRYVVSVQRGFDYAVGMSEKMLLKDFICVHWASQVVTIEDVLHGI